MRYLFFQDSTGHLNYPPLLFFSLQVSVISAFPGNYPPGNSIRHVQLTGIYDEFLKLLPDNLQTYVPPFVLSYAILYMGALLFELTMEHENMKRFLSDETLEFDLVIVESFGTEAFYAFGEYFNAPLIATSTTLNTNWLNAAIGNVEPWSFVPNQLLNASPEMGFLDRFNNVLLNLVEHAIIRLYSQPRQNQLVKKYFPRSTKTLQEVIQNDVCLAFVNTHYTIALPRPYVPNMIEMGGINIDRKVGALPVDFQVFLDSSSDGVILFSMGSIFQASNLNEEQRRSFIEVFAKLKQKVIWRYNLPDADQLPENIMARSWLPQKEIMAHPNVKLFITHGGMLGTTEGFYHGVPMIGIPIFGDQPVNVARNVQKGFAVALDKTNLTEQSISWAIEEVLNNPKYAKTVKALSAAYHDQQHTPQETVVYWSEFVVRNKCASFMRVPGQSMGVVEYNNLDVWFILIILVIGLVYAGFWVVKKIWQRVMGKGADVVKRVKEE